FGEHARVEQVDLHEAAESIFSGRAGADVDDASHGAAVLGREVAGVEVEPLEHFGRHDGGEAAEVEGVRNPEAVEVDGRVLRGRPSNDDVARDARSAGYARQVLDGVERVAVGTGRAGDLARLQSSLARFAGCTFTAHVDVDHVGRRLRFDRDRRR